MHNKVIQISPKPVPQEAFISESSLYDDHLYLQMSDFGGDPVEYDEAIDSIERELEPIATVNRQARTITFKKRSVVLKAWKQDVKATFKRFRENLSKKSYWTAEHELRHGVMKTFDVDDLFYDGYCKPLSEVISDYLAGYIPRTLHIGAIIDFHY